MTTLRTVVILLLILGTLSALALASLGESYTRQLPPITALRTALIEQGGRAIGQAQRAVRGAAELPVATNPVQRADVQTPAAPVAGTPQTAAGPTVAPLTPAGISVSTSVETRTPTAPATAVAAPAKRPASAASTATLSPTQTATPGIKPAEAAAGNPQATLVPTP